MNEFDYKGFSEQKLLEICQIDYGVLQSAASLSWVTKAYSMGEFLYEYTQLPATVPLNCYSTHGVDLTPNVYAHEINNNAPFFICYNDIKQKAYKEACVRPCYKVPTPLPWLRAKHNLQKSVNARGTLAYFQHSTPDMPFLENNADVVNHYVDDLLELPSFMHPICVCLHMQDVHNGSYKFFLNRGIPVYSAGNIYNTLFYKNFYEYF